MNRYQLALFTVLATVCVIAVILLMMSLGIENGATGVLVFIPIGFPLILYSVGVILECD